MSLTALPIIVTFIIAVLGTACVRGVALRAGIVDIPNANRKIHRTPTPLLGGIAVILAFSSGVLLAWPFLTQGYLLPKYLIGVLLGALILGIGGALDDRYALKPRQQIVFPVLAIICVIASGIGIDSIRNPFGEALRLDTMNVYLFSYHGLPYFLTLFADLFTFCWLLGMIYTTKFLDGLDGLVSGMTVIGALIIYAISLSSDVFQPETATLALITAAAFFGFLLWNWHPARIFLGESGSVFSGFILGTLAIISGSKVATALLIIGIPMLDVLWVIVRRLFIERRSPLQADRKHLHLRLVDHGLSQRQAVVLLYAITALFGLGSLFSTTRTKVFLLGGLIIAMLVIASIVVRRWRLHRRHLFLFSIFFVITCALASVALIRASLPPTDLRFDTVTANIHGQNFTLEVAETPAQRERGLQFRTSLEPTHGMLFRFSEEERYTFWMKNTLIPLDIVWIRDGVIQEIMRNVQPEPGVSDAQLHRYQPHEPVHAVIEFPAGTVDAVDMNTGDVLDLSTVFLPQSAI